MPQICSPAHHLCCKIFIILIKSKILTSATLSKALKSKYRSGTTAFNSHVEPRGQPFTSHHWLIDDRSTDWHHTCKENEEKSYLINLFLFWATTYEDHVMLKVDDGQSWIWNSLFTFQMIKNILGQRSMEKWEPTNIESKFCNWHFWT